MQTVTIRELRNHGGDVVGRPVAELRPIRSRGISAAALLERWRRLPSVDAHAFRSDVDAVIDQAL